MIWASGKGSALWSDLSQGLSNLRIDRYLRSIVLVLKGADRQGCLESALKGFEA